MTTHADLATTTPGAAAPGVAAPGSTAPGATTRDWAALVVIALAVLIVCVDATVLDIAVPHISASLNPTSTQLLWIIDVYSFVLAGLLIVMGALGDRVGRRRILLVGAAGFGAASLLAALATSPELLIAARVLQGVSGATLMPATLGLIRTIFTDARQRTLAIGVWGAMAAGGAAVGPVVGGWLLEHYWWGAVFLVNLPIMLVLVAVGPLVVPESKDPTPGRFDLVSAALAVLAMIPLVYAVKETVVEGPAPQYALAAAVGVAAGWAFARRQLTLRDPLLDLGLFRSPAFTAAVLANLLSVFALAGVLFFGSQYLQTVLGYSPLRTGLVLLPGMVATMAASLAAAALVRRWPKGTVLAAGLAVSAAGTALMLGLGVDSGVALFLAGFVLLGAGDGVAITLTSDLVVGAVPPARAGAASAVSETAYELGLALGVAVLGSVVMSLFRSGVDTGGLEPAAAAAARESIGAAVATGDPAVVESAREAFVGGVHLAAGLSTLVLAATAVMVYAVARRSRVAA